MNRKNKNLSTALDPLLNDEFEESFSESSSKARRSLLTACLMGATITVTGIEIQQITIGGATANQIAIDKILIIIAIVIVYFEMNFAIYSYSDYITKKIRLHKSRNAARNELHGVSEKAREAIQEINSKSEVELMLANPAIDSLVSAKESLDLAKRAAKNASFRLFFDIWLPHFIGLISLALVIAAALQLDVFYAISALIIVSMVVGVGIIFLKRKKLKALVKNIKKKYYRTKVNRIAEKIRNETPEGRRLRDLQDKARDNLIKSLQLEREKEK